MIREIQQHCQVCDLEGGAEMPIKFHRMVIDFARRPITGSGKTVPPR